MRRWKLVTGCAALAVVSCATTVTWCIKSRPAELHASLAKPELRIADAPPPAPPAPAPPPRCPAEPLLPTRLAEVRPPTELARLFYESPEKLGSASIGSPTRGRLFGGVELVANDGIAPEGDHPWGTETAVRSIERAVREVQRCFPATQKLHVGDISRKQGGWLRPHRSHQSGLDADIGYYYLDGPAWFQPATKDTLDRPRTWALIRALVEGGSVEMIFIDRSVQKLLREHVDAEDPSGASLFATNPLEGVIRHAPGHGAHFHVRFRDPASVELGARIASLVNRPVVRGQARGQTRGLPRR
ncbi:MAG: hypothetical protein HOV80_14635 [Polyangiaceae bacterium]|nr:hypothetical protein [Polyangiaceae bacterium]